MICYFPHLAVAQTVMKFADAGCIWLFPISSWLFPTQKENRKPHPWKKNPNQKTNKTPQNQNNKPKLN